MFAHLSRRQWLERTLLSGVCAGASAWPLKAWAAPPVFESKTLLQVAKALGAQSLAATADVRLDTLDYAENGAAVPVTLVAAMSGVVRMVLFVEKNPTPLIAVMALDAAMDAAVTLHTKLAQTSAVYAMAITQDGRAWFAKKEVKVVLGSCGSVSESSEQVDATRQPESTRIRAQLKGDAALVRMRMTHEMESGQRKNTAGKLVPAWHIEHVVIQHNVKPVITADWGPGVSKNPYLQFTLPKAKSGDKLTVIWRDNKGATRTDDLWLV